MQWDAFAWAAVALLLFAAETMAPGAFMLWLAFAATAVFFVVLAFPELPLLAQAAIFVVLGFAAIQVCGRWVQRREQPGDQPSLKRRAAALVGQVVPRQGASVAGRGRVQVADAYWSVIGPAPPAGTHVRIVGAEGMQLQ